MRWPQLPLTLEIDYNTGQMYSFDNSRQSAALGGLRLLNYEPFFRYHLPD